MAYRDSEWNIVSQKQKKANNKTKVNKNSQVGKIIWFVDSGLKLVVWKIKEEKPLSSIISIREWGEKEVLNKKLREWNDDDYYL